MEKTGKLISESPYGGAYLLDDGRIVCWSWDSEKSSKVWYELPKLTNEDVNSIINRIVK